ncbi:RDD family protein [Burkholderia pseudomallei]
MRDTKDYSSKTLKGRNLAWLVATLVLDVLILLVLAFHTAIQDLTPTAIAAVRTSLTVLLPIPVLILSSLISADHKAILVFWRFKFPLPGSRAFSVYAPADHRIDLTKLKKNVGAFPVEPRDQNAKWYGLYKQVDSDPSVADSHKNYLLFRDIAAMSLLLMPVLPVAMYFIGIDAAHILISVAVFFCQYLITAFSARTTGIRFVQNVLAVHASRKVTASRTTGAGKA